jgi:hypothetical protein
MVDPCRVKVGLSVTSRAQAVPQINIAQAVDISNLFIGGSSIVFVPQLLWLRRCFRQHAEMVKESLRCSYALRATTPCAGKAAVREKTCGHHGTAQRPGGIGKNRSPSSCRRWHRLVLAAAHCGGGDVEKAKRGRWFSFGAGSGRVKAVRAGFFGPLAPREGVQRARPAAADLFAQG